MCGIAGRFHVGGLPDDDAWHGQADRLLAHRGPDGSGVFRDGICELVHRRLALLDLTPTGHQPMPSADGTTHIVFNGEVYNHAPLRAEMIGRGHRFRGTSDTEVLLALYAEYGIDMWTRLRGMFTYAIYDSRKRGLLLGRDRFGIKPLYYAATPTQLVFASEPKAIVAARGFEPAIDRQACYDFLGLTYVPEPATGFANIHALPKASSLWIDASGTRTVDHGRIVAAPRPHQSTQQLVDRIEAALLQSVKQQAVADVPVAALLSGGIDSSLVVAAYTKTAAAPPKTFNVAFPDAKYDETKVALAVSRHFETDHQTIELDTAAMAPERMFELLSHFDQPFADTSLFAVYSVSKAIRERGIICTLSGDGGDEAFGGYGSFWRIERLIQLARMPSLVHHGLERIGRATTRLTADLGRQLAKAAGLARAMTDSSSYLLAGLSNYLDRTQKHELVLPEARRDLLEIERCYRAYELRGTTDLEEMSRRLTENYFALGLPGDMLRKVDVTSMKASIEVRVPMLDEDLVDVGLALAHAHKTDGKQGKLMLRALAARWLPPVVVNHPKQGFGVPLDRLVSPAFHDAAHDLLLSEQSRTRGVLASSVVARWLAMFRDAGAGHGGGEISRGGLYQRIFMLLALELFLRKHQLRW